MKHANHRQLWAELEAQMDAQDQMRAIQEHGKRADRLITAIGCIAFVFVVTLPFVTVTTLA